MNKPSKIAAAGGDLFPTFVRGLLRYYQPVRLPMTVRRRRAPWIHAADLTTLFREASHGISRVPCVVFPYLLGVSDRAEPGKRLALSTPPMLPSGQKDGVGAPE